MRSGSLVVVGALLTGCTTTQARHAHRAGEIAAGGGLGGMLLCGVTASAIPSHDDQIMRAGLVFVPISLLGALVYISTDQEVNGRPSPPQLTHRERRRAQAWELTKQAATAARSADCSQVQAIDPRVRDLDREFHGLVFLGDVAIVRCLRED